MDNGLIYPDPVNIVLSYSFQCGLVAWWNFKYDGKQYGAVVQLEGSEETLHRVLVDIKSTYKYARELKEKSDG